MAASYWDSTQRKFWTFSKQELAVERKRLEDADRNLVNNYPLPDRRHLSIYFSHMLGKLGKSLAAIRQQALATAQVYVRRFYLKAEIRRTNPYTVLATALYLACKMEECPQHIRIVLAEARHQWDDTSFMDVSRIGECEFTLISEMNSQLIVHHPYRSLHDLQANHFQLTQEEHSLAWSIINDHYLTDLPLMHPPHIIAITAMTLAVMLKPIHGGPLPQLHAAGLSSAMQNLGNARGGPSPAPPRILKLVDWLAEGSVDIEAVIECCQELISLYEVWETYNEKMCREQLSKIIQKG